MGGGLYPSRWPCILGMLGMGGQLLIGFIWLFSLQRSFDCLYILLDKLKIIQKTPKQQYLTRFYKLFTSLVHQYKSKIDQAFKSFVLYNTNILFVMKSMIRKIVAGPKKKTPFNGQQLDLTYITDRIIAMAYPASNFIEKTYRNSIDDVASYFNQYHQNNFLIINVSRRPYDYSKFGGRVREYEWADHQAPTITTLVQISHQIKQYLRNNKQGVVAVHCNHGKGRTGTAIIAFMLYMSLFHKSEEALVFYNSRRFSSDVYGVDQPCQTRYLGYLQRLLRTEKIGRKMIAYRLATINQVGLHNKYFVTIKKSRNDESLVQKFNFGQYSKIIGKPLIGDLFIEIFQQTWAGSKKFARINFHTFFLNPKLQLNIPDMSVVFKNNDIKCVKNNDEFSLKLDFQFYCLCHMEGSEQLECQCKEERKQQQKYWSQMVDHLEQVKDLKQTERNKYFYCQTIQVADKKEEVEEVEDIYELNKNMSNLFTNNAVKVGTVKFKEAKQGYTSSSSQQA